VHAGLMVMIFMVVQMVVVMTLIAWMIVVMTMAMMILTKMPYQSAMRMQIAIKRMIFDVLSIMNAFPQIGWQTASKFNATLRVRSKTTVTVSANVLQV
jgi:hypothetical protein